MPTSKIANFNIDRNLIRDTDWKLSRIDDPAEFSQFGTFCCGDEDLNDFIRQDALAHKIQLIVETYVLRQATGDDPVAFVSFCNDSIRLTDLQRRSKDALPNGKRYPSMPAVKIARLGVRGDLQGKHIGTHIINMTKEFFTTDNRTGCRFLTVDAYSKDNVLKFYEKNDFQFLKTQAPSKTTSIMYLDLKRLTK